MAVLEKFTKAFEQLKAARTLEYKHHLGLVDLDIELATRKVRVEGCWRGVGLWRCCVGVSKGDKA